MVNQVLIDIGGHFGTLVWNNPDSECVHIHTLKNFLWGKTGIPEHEQNIFLEGKLLPNNYKLSLSNEIHDPLIVRLKLPILGGKGGFGALLRGAGAKASKKLKTSTDDCRDLNGRRIRHVKNEQRLAEWYAGQKDKEKEEDKPKKKSEPATYNAVEDPKFASQIKQTEETIASSVEVGMKEAKRLQEIKAQKKEIEAAEQLKKKIKVTWDEFDDVSVPVISTNSNNAECKPNPIMSLESNNEAPTVVTTPKQEQEEEESTSSEDVLIDLEDYASSAELESLGLDRLKLELQKRGLKMGGTLKERAERLFSIKRKTPEEIDPSLLAVKDKKRKRSSSTKSATRLK